MKKIFMGEYYRTPAYGLVKTVARGINIEDENKNPMIIFVEVKEGGFQGETLLMNEDKFIEAINF